MSVFLSFCLVFSSIHTEVLALAWGESAANDQTSVVASVENESEVARYNNYPVYKRENVYWPFSNYQYGTNYGDYYYSDGYFADDALSTTNQHLYTTSIHLAVAAFNSNYYGDYSNGPKRALDFLSKNGFGNTQANSDYYIQPTASTIGVAAGFKYVKEGDYYIVAASIRGGDYESEWMSNLTLGTSDNASGFQAAADKVANGFLYDYVENNETLKNAKDKIKVWITGFSRGAAVANLSAKILSDRFGSNDVFAYCFATPQGATTNSSAYDNIRNVVYDDDVVPKLAPSYMNFVRYGKTLYYSNSTTDMIKYDEELKKFSPTMTRDDNFQQATFHVLNSVQGGSGFNPTPTGSKQTQEEYLNNLILKIKEWGIVPSRNDYSTRVIEGAATYEKTFSVLADIMLNSSNKNLMNSLSKSFSDLDYGKYYTLYRMITQGSESMPFEDRNVFGWTTVFSNGRKSVYDAIWKNFSTNGGTSGMTETQKSDLKSVWYAVCRLAIDFIYNDSGGGGNATNLGTFMYNSDRINADHYPQRYMAFLRLDDPYYQGGTATITYQTNNSAFTLDSQSTLIGGNPVATHSISHDRFVGWYLDAELTKPFDPTTYVVSGDFTLYGKWRKYTNVYAWSGEAPEGVSAPSDTLDYNSEEEARAAVDTTYTTQTVVSGKKDGRFGAWTFNGWTSSETDANTLVTNHYGSWSFKEDEYRVKYNWGSQESVDYPAGVTLPSNDNVYNTEDEAKASVDSVFASGYSAIAMKGGVSGEWTFSGWSGSKTNHDTKEVTFYGSWVFEANPEIYDLYIAIEGESVQTFKIVQGTTINLSDYTPQPKDGYIFDGWYQDSFVTKVSDNQPVQSSMVFAGRWIKQTTIVYDWGSDFPSTATLPSDSNRYDTADLARAAIDTTFTSDTRVDEQDGFWLFSGWTSETFDSDSATLTVKGQWTNYKDVQITFIIDNAQDAITSTKTVSFRQGENVNLGEYTPQESDKYTFDGWYIDGTTEKLTTLTAGSTSLTLRGDIVNKYTLKYEWSSDSDIPQGVTLPINTNYYNSESEAREALDQTIYEISGTRGEVDGVSGTWKFSGWYDSNVNSHTNVITYKGTWTFEKDAVTYTVSFVGDPSDGSATLVDFREGTKVTLSDFMPYREGYSFDGWYDRDGSEGQWGNLLDEIVITSNLTVYAKWSAAKVTYKLTYISEGAPYNQQSLPTLPQGQKWNVYNFTPERDGYIFDGWYIDEALTTRINSLIVMDSDKTVYAKWTKDSSSDPSPSVEPKIEVTSFTGSGSLAINGISVSAGGSYSYTPGTSLTISWQPASVASNVTFIKSLKVNGKELISINDVDRSKWQITNSIYRDQMGDTTAVMTTYDAVVNTEQKIVVDAVSNDTTQAIEVEFAEYVPVYRLYNTITSEHLFTTNKSEYDSFVEKSKGKQDFWIGEGIDWFAEATPQVADASTVRRLYNKDLGAMGRSSHYYSKDASEIATLLKNGWVDDGAANYIQSGGSVPIWTCYNEGLGSAHHYTSNKSEWQSLSSYGWHLETDKNSTTGVFQAVMSAKP